MSCYTSIQVQVSGSTYNTVLKNLHSDTVYTVTVVPVYSAGEGQRMSENGKTCKHIITMVIHAGTFRSSSNILGREISGFRVAHADREDDL